MNKFLSEIKKWALDINTTNWTQVVNYIILIVLAAFVKIFLITMIHGEVFVTGFEICVWAFMMIWLILRAVHSLEILQGYYSFAGIFILLYILVGTSNTYFIYFSMAIVVIGRIFEIKELFAKGEKDE